MPAMGLALGAGAGQGLEEVLTRMMEQAKFEQLKKTQQDQQNEAVRSHTENEAIHREQIASTERERVSRDAMINKNYQDQSDRAARDDGRALADTIPADTFLPKDSPAIPLMEKGGVGSLLRMKSSLPSTSTVGGATMPTGDEKGGDARDVSGVTVTSQEKPQEIGRIKLRSYNQEKEQALETDRRGQRGETVRHDKAVENKPPAPDRVLIQTDNGYMPRSTAAATLANGGTVPLATTSSTRTMEEGAKMLRPGVADLATDAQELEKRNLFGPAMSRIRDIMAKAGTTLSSNDPDESARAWGSVGQAIANDPQLSTDRLVGRFASELGLMATGAGRVHGGARGGGSAQMLEHFKNLLSSSSTLPMFLGRMDALDRYLAKYAAGPGGAPVSAAPGATPAGDKKTPIKYDLKGNIVP